MIGCPRTVTEQMSPNVFFEDMLGRYVSPERRVRTPCLAPLCKGFPFLLSGHVKDVSNERKTFWPRGEGSAPPDSAEKTVQDEESKRGENESCKVEKFEHHRFNKTTGGGRIQRGKRYLWILDDTLCIYIKRDHQIGIDQIQGPGRGHHRGRY